MRVNWPALIWATLCGVLVINTLRAPRTTVPDDAAPRRLAAVPPHQQAAGPVAASFGQPAPSLSAAGAAGGMPVTGAVATPHQPQAAPPAGPRLSAEKGTEVYYHGTYWNDYEAVRRHINKMATGDSTVDWMTFLGRWHGGRPFAKALFLSCGNGWVERDMAQRGLITDAVGIDIDAALLEEARAQARKAGRPFRYYQLDANRDADLPEGGFDLVVNHASLHHIAFIDRHVRKIAQALSASGGVLASFDYIGPHRNQYRLADFQAARTLNNKLPTGVRHPSLAYPHLPTMLTTDPSEAIHSELILATVDRYFESVHRRPVGGALAYLLLTHNPALANVSATQLEPWLDFITKADEEHTRRVPESSLFAFSVDRPRAGALADAVHLAEWARQEAAREAAAREAGGAYYPQTDASEMVYGKFPAPKSQQSAK